MITPEFKNALSAALVKADSLDQDLLDLMEDCHMKVNPTNGKFDDHVHEYLYCMFKIGELLPYVQLCLE